MASSMAHQPIKGDRKQIGQITNYLHDMIEDFLLKSGLDRDEGQRVFENRRDLARAMRTKFGALLNDLSVSEEYKEEEVVYSDYGYRSGYTAPKSLKEQYEILRQFFPHLGHVDETIPKRKVQPDFSEGWFAIPQWQKIARTYPKAVDMVFEALDKIWHSERTYYGRDKVKKSGVFQTTKTETGLGEIREQQKNPDILVVPAQFGLRHRGRSARRARAVMRSSEFGLGVFAVGIMLLTHPERQLSSLDLWMHCAGDKFDKPKLATGVPKFGWSDLIHLMIDDHSNFLASHGTVSAFVPKLGEACL